MAVAALEGTGGRLCGEAGRRQVRARADGGLEQRLKSAEEDHKALTRAELTIAGLEQKSAARESQFKAAEDERKEMAKQLAELRERLAKVEGATEAKPMPKPATGKAN